MNTFSAFLITVGAGLVVLYIPSLLENYFKNHSLYYIPGIFTASVYTEKMGDDYSRPTTCLRWFFAACNIVFLVFGLLSLAIGIWGVVASSDGHYEELTGGNLITAAVLLIVAGFITIVVSILGFCGAAGMWRPILVIYAVAVCVIVAIEIVSAITAFVFADQANDELRENMENAISNYRVNDSNETFDEATNTAVESVQGIFECCGVTNYTDWMRLNPGAVEANNGFIPARCYCDVNEENCLNDEKYNITNVWDRGCLTLLEDYLEDSSLINGIIGIIIAAIEISLVVMAFCLCGCVHKDQKYT